MYDMVGRWRVTRPRRRAWSPCMIALACALTGTFGGALGCVGDRGVAPALRPPETTLGTIVVSPLNAVMAVGDTLSLALHARSLTGVPIASLDSVQYVLENTGDSLRVQIDAHGVMTAVAPSLTNSPVLVQVIGFKDGLARADQAVVQVTDTRFSGATLSIQPIPPDSTSLALGWNKVITPVIQNPVSGQSVDDPTVRFEFGAGDSTKLQCYIPVFVETSTLVYNQLMMGPCGGNNNFAGTLNQILVNAKGTAWVIAAVTVYGVPLRDSVQYTLTNPISGYVQVGLNNLSVIFPGASSAFISPGATVTFQNILPIALGASVTYTFDDSTVALATTPASPNGGTSGNITAIQPNQTATRRFLAPGVHKWTATVIGGIPPYAGQTDQGTITVE